MKFLPTTVYVLTFHAIVVAALSQEELGPQAKCGRALKLLSEADPAALEVLDIPESQVELDKESHERIYQGREPPNAVISVMIMEIFTGGDAHASTLTCSARVLDTGAAGRILVVLEFVHS
ncbi:hypothetical protein N7488_009077 [Penicillium malachiteum]|nr:hypothetical protein N7488_009077 [Penicillium malachiteum]